MDLRDIGAVAGGAVHGLQAGMQIAQGMEAIKSQQQRQALTGMQIAEMKRQEAEYNAPIAVDDIMARVPEQYRPYMSKKIAGAGIVETDPAGKPFIRKGRMGEVKDSLAVMDYFNMSSEGYRYFTQKEDALKKQIDDLKGTLQTTIQQYKEEGAMAPPPRESSVQELASYKKKNPMESEDFKKGVLGLKTLYQQLDSVKQAKLQNFMTINKIQEGGRKLVEKGVPPELVMSVMNGEPGSDVALVKTLRSIADKERDKKYDMVQMPDGTLQYVEKGAEIPAGATIPQKVTTVQHSGGKGGGSTSGAAGKGTVEVLDENGKPIIVTKEEAARRKLTPAPKGKGGPKLQMPGINSGATPTQSTVPAWQRYAK